MDRDGSSQSSGNSASTETPSAQAKARMIAARTPRDRIIRAVVVIATGLALVLAGGASPALARTSPDALPEVALADLPKEARDLRGLIDKGGPFHYNRDGVIFGNREHILPAKPR